MITKNESGSPCNTIFNDTIVMSYHIKKLKVLSNKQSFFQINFEGIGEKDESKWQRYAVNHLNQTQ